MKRWYLGTIIIPILLTYLTNYFNLPKILEDWNFAVFVTLIIIICILSYELHMLNLKHKRLINKPKKSDKKIVKKLIKTLNVNFFKKILLIKMLGTDTR